MSVNDHTGSQNYGVYARERTVVFIHGPNFYNAHRALNVIAADYMKLRNFFEKYTDLFGIHYFNVAPNNQELPSPVERLCRFLERKSFSVYLKWVDLFIPAEVPQTPVVTPHSQNDFTSGRLSLASKSELYDTTPQPTASAERPRMPRVTLTAEIMSLVIEILLLSKTRPHAAIQRVVLIGGEYDYVPFIDLLNKLGVRITLIGLNNESVPVTSDGYIPPFAMLPYSLRQGAPAQFVDLSMYIPFIRNDEVERRRDEGQGSGFSDMPRHQMAQ